MQEDSRRIAGGYKIRKSIIYAYLIVIASATAVTSHDVRNPATRQKPSIQNLFTTALKNAEGVEVIVSHVALPPNFTLPTHWHPGEEFAYIQKGSATLILDGEVQQGDFAGDVAVVPLKKVHTASSGGAGTTILVFRIY